MKKFNCFVISPIGESGTQTRRDADDFLSLIVEPALNEFGFSVTRGDHRSEANQIDIDVIKSVQEADLCICNLSESNINVYYELGRRDETGKPVILLKPKKSEDLPIDIATRRYIEYDLDDRHGIIDARIQLSNFVRPLVEKGLSGNSKAATLSELADILQRIERKIDRSAITKRHSDSIDTNISSCSNAMEQLRYAKLQGNIPLAEAAMSSLKYSMDLFKYLDQVVRLVSDMGSEEAGQLIIDHAQDFMDSTDTTMDQKVRYLESLVLYASKRDKEKELLNFLEPLADQILRNLSEDDTENLISVKNQKNKLYYGTYIITDDKIWLQKAINELESAIKILPTDYLYSNLSHCYEYMEDFEKAVEQIDKCLALQDEDNPDADHIEQACRLYYLCQKPKFEDMFAWLEQISNVKAALLRDELGF